MDDKLRQIAPRDMTDVKQLQDGLVMVINLFEQQLTINEEQRKEISSLKDEINVLKGEDANPKFPAAAKAKQPLAGTGPVKKKSGKGKNHKSGSKKNIVKINKTVTVIPDLSSLPADAMLKEYKTLIQQDIRFEIYNTAYRVAIYHSISEGKTYRGKMPEDYQGQFGLGLTSLTQLLHHFGDMTQGRLEAVYDSLGVDISSGTISNIITEKGDWAIKEQKDILCSGITHSPFTQGDGTKAVERGKSLVTQIICGEKFSVFLTMPGKSRLDVLAALQGKPSEGLRVSWNELSGDLMENLKVGKCHQESLLGLLPEQESFLLTELEEILDGSSLANHPKLEMRAKQALALSYYLKQQDFPVVRWLLSDDAGEYTKIATEGQALCWIHDGRYYRKLVPRLDVHKAIHEKMLTDYWAYYAKLAAYRKAKPEQRAQQRPILEQEFDTLFNQTTDYFQVNECLARTYANKEKLLAVLDNPAIPLHNNAAELGARRVVRKRDISLHTWSEKGTKVRDAYMTIVETAAKLGVNAMSYIKDRLSGQLLMPSLAQCVAEAYQDN
jgi:hypothetical protein